MITDSITGGMKYATLNEDDADTMAWGNVHDKTGDNEAAALAGEIARDAATLARYALAILWEVVEGPGKITQTDEQEIHEYAGALRLSLEEYARHRPIEPGAVEH